jgi:hypothetical protein
MREGRMNTAFLYHFSLLGCGSLSIGRLNSQRGGQRFDPA